MYFSPVIGLPAYRPWMAYFSKAVKSKGYFVSIVSVSAGRVVFCSPPLYTVKRTVAFDHTFATKKAVPVLAWEALDNC